MGITSSAEVSASIETGENGEGGIDDSRRRFQQIPGDTEWAEDYESGGYCPVTLGQIFNNRYRILRKLGWGQDSTVWLAHDGKSSRYVALKICTASSTAEDREGALLQRLTDHTTSSKGVAHTQVLWDSFEHESANGKHHILVLEPLGRTLDEHLQNESSLGDFDKPLPKAIVKEISRQIVLGLNHIHSCGIVHRDLQPGNIAFALQRDFDLVSADVLEQPKWYHDQIFEIKRHDWQDLRPLEPGVPPYIAKSRPLDDGVSLGTSPTQIRVVVIDLSAASSFDDINDGREAFPVAMRPPELVLGMPMLAPQSDIWALGCLIFELVTRRKMFSVGQWDTPEKNDDDYLQSITEILGPLPTSFLSRWKTASDVVDDDGNLLPKVVERGIHEPLEDRVKMFKPDGMDEAEAELFLDFLKQMLRFEPSERARTEELLQHSWLQSSDVESVDRPSRDA